MKFKIDENLPDEVATALQNAGFEADTVAQEGMSGAADVILAEKAQKDSRVIVTLDLDFGNVQRFRQAFSRVLWS